MKMKLLTVLIGASLGSLATSSMAGEVGNTSSGTPSICKTPSGAVVFGNSQPGVTVAAGEIPRCAVPPTNGGAPTTPNPNTPPPLPAPVDPIPPTSGTGSGGPTGTAPTTTRCLLPSGTVLTMVDMKVVSTSGINTVGADIPRCPAPPPPNTGTSPGTTPQTTTPTPPPTPPSSTGGTGTNGAGTPPGTTGGATGTIRCKMPGGAIISVPSTYVAAMVATSGVGEIPYCPTGPGPSSGTNGSGTSGTTGKVPPGSPTTTSGTQPPTVPPVTSTKPAEPSPTSEPRAQCKLPTGNVIVVPLSILTSTDVAFVLSGAIPDCPSGAQPIVLPPRMDDPAGLTGRPGTLPNILKLNKYTYFPGDAIKIEVVYPASIQSVWNGEAVGNVVVYLSNGQPVSVPIPAVTAGKSQQLLDLPSLDTSVLPPGTYHIALILTKTGGDALKLSDWYAGFRSLVSIAQFRIMPSRNTTMTTSGEIDAESGFGASTPAPTDVVR